MINCTVGRNTDVKFIVRSECWWNLRWTVETIPWAPQWGTSSGRPRRGQRIRTPNLDRHKRRKQLQIRAALSQILLFLHGSLLVLYCGPCGAPKIQKVSFIFTIIYQINGLDQTIMGHVSTTLLTRRNKESGTLRVSGADGEVTERGRRRLAVGTCQRILRPIFRSYESRTHGSRRGNSIMSFRFDGISFSSLHYKGYLIIDFYRRKKNI